MYCRIHGVGSPGISIEESSSIGLVCKETIMINAATSTFAFLYVALLLSATSDLVIALDDESTNVLLERRIIRNIAVDVAGAEQVSRQLGVNDVKARQANTKQRMLKLNQGVEK